ncbi:hypothetical protein CIC07_04260 [Paenibacillus sp. RUD330]|nr:hypothetical protein CIC07_04260 [Paenibacillus sp. RUD330]
MRARDLSVDLKADRAAGSGNSCKGCRESVAVPESHLARILAKIRPEDSVSEQLYEQRLSACASCESLSYGTTCMHCGCLVAIRARLKPSHCPHPSADKRASWEMAVQAGEHAQI